MRVSEAMTRAVRVCKPGQSILACAKAMADLDTGVLPVGEDNRLIGMITDRDIAIRAVAAGKGPQTPVGEVMSREVLFCYDDQDLEYVAKSMGEARVRRVPVIDRAKRLVGIVSLADVALKHDAGAAAAAIAALCRHGGPHSQHIHQTAKES
jgi:CBS domain-containing protein